MPSFTKDFAKACKKECELKKFMLNDHIEYFSFQKISNLDLKLKSKSQPDNKIYMGVVINGNFEGGFDSKTSFEFSKNTMVLQDLQEINSGYIDFRKNDCVKLIGIRVEKDFLKEMSPNLALPKRPQKINLKPISSLLAKNAFELISDKSKLLKVQSFILEFISKELLETHAKQKHSRLSLYDKSALKKAKELLENSLEPISIKTLSRSVGLNEFKLKSGFKELFFTSPHKLSLHLRLEYAQKMLQNKRLNICEISNMLGFKHQQSFSLAFKKLYGYKPKDLLKNDF